VIVRGFKNEILRIMPTYLANPTSKAPAGISRVAATNIGPALGRIPFIATIAVPQKKKGDIKSKVLNTDSINVASISLSSSLLCPTTASFALSANFSGAFTSPSWNETTHSTSHSHPQNLLP
jgi:hypothetical protein